MALPAPTPVQITATAAANERWDETSFTLYGAQAVAAELKPVVQPFGAIVKTSLYPGRWQLSVHNYRIGTIPFTLNVDDAPFDLSIELAALHRFRLRVADAYGAPVTGAYAMLFSNGRLVDASRSSGELPIEFRVRPPFEGEVLVVDPRRGEGRLPLSSSGDDEIGELRLRDEVMSISVPDGRPTRDALAARLGGKLVARDRGFVLDFDAATPGTRAGLRRGDFIVSAWPEGAKLRVMAFRQGSGYIDVAVP